VIVAQELERYGVAVNGIAPNARTRMDGVGVRDASGRIRLRSPRSGGQLTARRRTQRGRALRITGQVFHIFGGAVSLPQPWTPRELSLRDDGWDSEALLAELLDRFPDGAAPEGLAAAMERAGDVQKA
jgi:hypothetical protein